MYQSCHTGRKAASSAILLIMRLSYFPVSCISMQNLRFYTLKRYPTPQIVSILGFCCIKFDFFPDFLICTVTVAISPMDSISQILENSSSFVKTWLGFWARKVKRSNSLVVKFFSSPLIHTLLAVLSIFRPRIFIISFSGFRCQSAAHTGQMSLYTATISLGLNGFVI